MENHKILIELESYEVPNPIAEYGARLAKSLNVPAQLVAIEELRLELGPGAFTQSTIYQYDTFAMRDVMEAAKPQMEAITDWAKTHWENTSYSLETGFRESTLIEKTEAELPLLVVVERKHHLTTLNEWFGTHETRLAVNIPYPVLVVPKEAENWQPVERILYVMDVSDNVLDNVKTLQNLASRLGAAITVAAIFEEEFKENNPAFLTATTLLRQSLSPGTADFVQIFTANAAKTVEELALETGADWLAFQQKDKSFLARIFDQYNNEHLILHSKIPVLVL